MDQKRNRGFCSTACIRLLAAVAASSVLLPLDPAFGRESVLWAALDFPPFQIRDGHYRGSGSFDGLLDLLTEQLREYDHEVVTMTFARREEEMRQGQRLCTPGLFRTAARERLLVFSLPALIHLDNRLVFLASRADRIGSREPADLEALLKRSDLVGGIIAGRSFAPNIDPLLRQYENAANIVMRPLRSSQMFEMLIDGEIDYTILFPHEAAYLARQHGRSGDIVVRPIANTPPYIFTQVACTKGAWGEAIIDRINRVLAEQQRNPAYRSLSERWYTEPDKEQIRKYYPNLLAPATLPQ